jgi:hypothetical protein
LPAAGPGDGVRRLDDLLGRDARFRRGILRRELRVLRLERRDEALEGFRQARVFDLQVLPPVHPIAHEVLVVEIFLEKDPDHRQQQRPLGPRVRRQPEVGLGGGVGEPRINRYKGCPLGLRLDDPLRVGIEVVARLEMRREEQDRPGVRVVGRRPVRARPQEMSQARR